MSITIHDVEYINKKYPKFDFIEYGDIEYGNYLIVSQEIVNEVCNVIDNIEYFTENNYVIHLGKYRHIPSILIKCLKKYIPNGVDDSPLYGVFKTPYQHKYNPKYIDIIKTCLSTSFLQIVKQIKDYNLANLYNDNMKMYTLSDETKKCNSNKILQFWLFNTEIYNFIFNYCLEHSSEDQKYIDYLCYFISTKYKFSNEFRSTLQCIHNTITCKNRDCHTCIHDNKFDNLNIEIDLLCECDICVEHMGNYWNAINSHDVEPPYTNMGITTLVMGGDTSDDINIDNICYDFNNTLYRNCCNCYNCNPENTSNKIFNKVFTFDLLISNCKNISKLIDVNFETINRLICSEYDIYILKSIFKKQNEYMQRSKQIALKHYNKLLSNKDLKFVIDYKNETIKYDFTYTRKYTFHGF